MFFDGPTFLLVFLALLGRHRRAVLCRRTLSVWKRAAAGLVIVGILLVLLGRFEWLVMIALGCVELGVLVAYLGAHRAATSPRRRVGLRLAVAFLLHLLFVVLAPNVRLEVGQGATPLWFVDLIARGWGALIEPMLTFMGPSVAARDVLDILTPGLAFLGASLVSLQFVWSYLAVGLILRIVMREAFPERVQLELEGLGLGSVGVFGLSVAFAQGPNATFGVQLLASALAALFAVYGLYGVWARSRGLLSSGWRLPVAAAVAVVLFAHPVLWWALGAVGVVETLIRRGRLESASVRTLTAAVSRRLHRGLGPLVLVGFVVPALAVGGGVTQLITGDPPARLAVPPAVEGAYPSEAPLRLPALDGTLLQVDRYELPNRRGVMPQVGLTPTEAQAACAERGARLCTVAELGLVCSSGKGERFLGGGAQGFFSGDTVRRLQSDCNFGRVEDDAVRGLRPSGDSAMCRGDWAVYDLVGNVNEWATISGEPGFLGLVGSDYRYDDLLLLTCGSHVLVPVSFVDYLDLRAVGARCCH
jgi:hypothetical protein